MENKIDWKTFGWVAFIIFIVYIIVKELVDPTPCYPGEVVELDDGRRGGICQTTMEEYDAWAQKHMKYDEYLKWRASVKDEFTDHDE